MTDQQPPQGPAFTSAEGQQQPTVGLRIDQRDAPTQYVNAFRHHTTGEEIMLDVGVNRLEPTGDKERPVSVHFQIGSRLVLNYYTAKRLAIAIGQMVRTYEDQFGELELDLRKRRKDGGDQS